MKNNCFSKKKIPEFVFLEMLEIAKNQNKGKEDILDIDSLCPYLLFGETTSHLTSKWMGTFQYFPFLFNVENSIKREMKWERIVFLKKHIFFNVGNSIQREENMKYWKQKFFNFFFQ